MTRVCMKYLIIVILNCDGDALEQESRLMSITDSGTQPPTYLVDEIEGSKSCCTESFKRDWHKDQSVWEGGILGLLT